MTITDMGKSARATMPFMSQVTTEKKNIALLAIADALLDNKDRIIAANAVDMQNGRDAGLSDGLLDRLMLDSERIDGIADGVRNVASLDEPCGKVVSTYNKDNGLVIKKVTVPIGVIGIIFEARPNVTVDAAALCLKSGNAVILRGGKEAINSNTAMLFKAHKSNYEIAGFSKEVDYQELIALAQEKGLLDYYDLGSGYFGLKGLDILKKYEMPLEEIASLNPSLVSFSGDKLLGGAQAGIIFGKKCYIDQLKQNQLLRMLRVDKFTLAALEATLMAYLQGKYEKIPTYKMLLQTKEVLKKKAEKLLELIQESFKPIILETKGYSGGGAMPNKALESFGIALSFSDEEKLEQLLRERGIIARVENGKVILDVMALLEGDEKIIQKALLDIKESYAR